LLVLKDGLAASQQLLIGTITVSNPTGSTGYVQIQARRRVGGTCSDETSDEMAPMMAAAGETKSFSFPLPLKFPSYPTSTEWCLVAETGANGLVISVVAR
jgi:hypothetical protein